MHLSRFLVPASLLVALLAACGRSSDGRFGSTTTPPPPPSADATPATCAAGQLKLTGKLAGRAINIEEKIEALAFAAPSGDTLGYLTIVLQDARGHLALSFAGAPGEGAVLPARAVVATDLKKGARLTVSNCGAEPFPSTLRLELIDGSRGTLTLQRLRDDSTPNCEAEPVAGVVSGCFAR